MKWQLYLKSEIFSLKKINALSSDGQTSTELFYKKDDYLIFGSDNPDTAIRFLIPVELGITLLEGGYYFFIDPIQVFFGKADTPNEEASQ